MSSAAPRLNRIMLKLSGEALSGQRASGLDADALHGICTEIAQVVELQVEVAVVVGGGNFFRGGESSNLNISRTSADYIGMLATVMNALALQQALLAAGIDARVQTAIAMTPICDPFNRERALNHLAQQRVVIFAAGTGSPFFTTDTAASLRAIELEADLLVKATQVDGVYDRDPKRYAEARRYERIGYDAVLSQNLGVMDATAIALCREHGMPLRVFDLKNPGCLSRIVKGESSESTLVDSEVDV